ncbi:sister chromatid cohesion protein DCC1 [Planococcus citri]|uniref:sister chromatid cohesion protein DCC1 n=1 Tax=Planococcus citri TaxID=170843 RepID=UPI0031F9196E
MEIDTPEKQYIRTVEDVTKIIHHAKLNEKTLAPISQAIYFSGDTKQYRLLELDNELLSKLKNGIELSFKGKKDQKAVLCSDCKTYEVKEAETSNSLLLIPQLKFPDDHKSYSGERMVEDKEVIGVFHTYLEVKPCKPKFQKLRKILESSSFRGSELEPELRDSGVTMYSTEELLHEIQASHVELITALNDIYAFQLDGKWRILEFQYHFRVLSAFMNVIDTQSWKCDEIPADEVMELLDGIVPSYIVQYLLSIYTEEVPQNTSSDGRVVKLIEDRVCRMLGESTLKRFSHFELKDFLNVWQGAVPEGLVTNLRQLDGLVYIDVQKNQKNINYCPEYELAEDPGERIHHLFQLKPKWTIEEIKPYIQVFATEKVNENMILMKYARASNNNGVRFYSSKHGK